MDEFLNMGGYARYVWPSFGLAFTILAWNLWSALRMHAAARERALRRVAAAATAARSATGSPPPEAP